MWDLKRQCSCPVVPLHPAYRVNLRYVQSCCVLLCFNIIVAFQESDDEEEDVEDNLPSQQEIMKSLNMMIHQQQLREMSPVQTKDAVFQKHATKPTDHRLSLGQMGAVDLSGAVQQPSAIKRSKTFSTSTRGQKYTCKV